jgi:hypothetical protein
MLWIGMALKDVLVREGYRSLEPNRILAHTDSTEGLVVSEDDDRARLCLSNSLNDIRQLHARHGHLRIACVKQILKLQQARNRDAVSSHQFNVRREHQVGMQIVRV